MNRIYLVTNLANDKKYVGCTQKAVAKRWAQHVKASRQKTSHYALHEAIKEYGVGKFLVQELWSNEDTQFAYEVMEERFIRFYNSHFFDGWGYNMTYGGGGAKGYHHSMSSQRQGRNNGNAKMFLIIWPDGTTEMTPCLSEWAKANGMKYQAAQYAASRKGPLKSGLCIERITKS
jgi:group I intron endonuclease